MKKSTSKPRFPFNNQSQHFFVHNSLQQDTAVISFIGVTDLFSHYVISQL